MGHALDDDDSLHYIRKNEFATSYDFTYAVLFNLLLFMCIYTIDCYVN